MSKELTSDELLNDAFHWLSMAKSYISDSECAFNVLHGKKNVRADEILAAGIEALDGHLDARDVLNNFGNCISFFGKRASLEKVIETRILLHLAFRNLDAAAVIRNGGVK
jgi:hypothetical protein